MLCRWSEKYLASKRVTFKILFIMNNASDYPEPYEFNTEGVKVIKLFSNKTSLIQSLDQEVTVVAVQFLSHVRSFVGPWSTACQAHLSFTISWSLLKLISIESMMLSISSSATLFSFCPQSFQAPGSFPVSWFLTSDGQSIGASASVLPMNIQGLLPLGLTLQSKGLSRIFSKSINSSVFSLLDSPTLTSIRDYWKKHSFDCMYLCRQSDVSAF